MFTHTTQPWSWAGVSVPQQISQPNTWELQSGSWDQWVKVWLTHYEYKALNRFTVVYGFPVQLSALCTTFCCMLVFAPHGNLITSITYCRPHPSSQQMCLCGVGDRGSLGGCVCVCVCDRCMLVIAFICASYVFDSLMYCVWEQVCACAVCAWYMC